MSEELKFQKLSEVELHQTAPENAHPLAEHDGKIIRVAGGLGGGIPTIDLTPAINDAEQVDLENLEATGTMMLYASFTEEETNRILDLARQGAIAVKVNMRDIFALIGAGTMFNFDYWVNQVYSTQTISTEDANGAILYAGLTDLMFSRESDLNAISMVGFLGGTPQSQFAVPVALFGLSGLTGVE